MYFRAPTMSSKKYCAGEAIKRFSNRSNVYFMLCAVTLPVAGGEKANPLRIWNA